MIRDLFYTSLQTSQAFSESPHGRMGTATPTGPWDYVLVIVSIVVVLVSLYLCLKYFLCPKETEEDHIKKRILADDVMIEQDTAHERER